LAKTEVSTVTVIEIAEDVIGLVAPHIGDERLRVIHADALQWMPQKVKRWNVVWHDIWEDICADNFTRWRSRTTGMAGDVTGRAAGAATSTSAPK